MPGKGNIRSFTEDRREVDILVQEIKENLHLEDPVVPSGPAGLSTPLKASRRSRHCPYAVPKQLRDPRRRYPSSSKSLEDPFRMLQELISDGSLIKEAVRRLQLGLSPKLSPNSVVNYYTDSDEDCRSPAKNNGYNNSNSSTKNTFCQLTTSGGM